MKKPTKIQQKRIEILKDVLKHIKANRIVGEEHNCVIDYGRGANIKEKDLQKVLKLFSRRKEKCKVCMRGSLLFSSVWKNNNLSVKWGGWDGEGNLLTGTADQDNTNHAKYLNKLFTKENQYLMERAFEGMFHNDKLSNEECEICDDNYFYKYSDPTERITKIVENAISNNGTFIP